MKKPQIMGLCFRRLGIDYAGRDGIDRRKLCELVCAAQLEVLPSNAQRQLEYLSKFAYGAQLQVTVLPQPKVHAPQPKKIKKRNNRGGDLNLDEFFGSKVWRTLRMTVLIEQGARCQCCGRTAKDGVRMNVDHIKPRRQFPELALEKSNLQVLCEDCNAGKGSWDQTDWRSAPPA